jgi:hypothetical protein
MKRAALAFACLLCAASAWAAPSPDLRRRAVRLMREIRLESLNPVKNAAPLRAKLEALRKENAAAPDASVAARLKKASDGLDCLETGRPLPPPDGEEASADGPPAEPTPLPAPPPAPEVLHDAVAAVPPEAGAAYFDLSQKRASSAPVVAGKPTARPASASLEKYLALAGDEERHAHLRTVTADLFARIQRKDPGAKASIILARRLHEHLSTHPQKDQFASLSLSATADSHLHLIYRLKSGALTDEDLGTLDEWSTDKASASKPGKGGRGGGGGGGSKKGGKKGAKGGDGDDDGDGGGGSSKRKSKGGGGKRRGGGKSGGASGGDAGDDGGSASSGGGHGKGARAPKKRGGGSMFDGGEGAGGDAGPGGGRGGRAGRGSKRGAAGAERGTARVKGGRRLESGEGEGPGAGAKKSDRRVPLPKGFPIRRDRLEGGPGGASAKAGKSAKGGDGAGDSGGAGGGKAKSSKGAEEKNPDKSPEPNHALTAGGPASPAPSAMAPGASVPASAPLRAPVPEAEDGLRDAVAAHSAQAAPSFAPAPKSAPGRAPVPAEDDPWAPGALALAGAAAGLGALALRSKSSPRAAPVSREESV